MLKTMENTWKLTIDAVSAAKMQLCSVNCWLLEFLVCLNVALIERFLQKWNYCQFSLILLKLWFYNSVIFGSPISHSMNFASNLDFQHFCMNDMIDSFLWVFATFYKRELIGSFVIFLVFTSLMWIPD